MRDLTVNEVEQVSGGNPVLAFFAGYLAGKALDSAVAAYVAHVNEFAGRTHSTITPLDGWGTM